MGPGVHRGRSGERPCLGCTDHSLPGPRDCEPVLSLPTFNHRCGCAGLGPLWAPRGFGRPAVAVLLAPGSTGGPSAGACARPRIRLDAVGERTRLCFVPLVPSPDLQAWGPGPAALVLFTEELDLQGNLRGTRHRWSVSASKCSCGSAAALQRLSRGQGVRVAPGLALRMARAHVPLT